MEIKLSNLQISDLCRELSMLLHAGVGLGDGLTLLAEEEKTGQLKMMLEQMAYTVESGAMLADAFEQAGCFPTYVTGLIKVGERVGRAEEALASLSRYYEEREVLDR